MFKKKILLFCLLLASLNCTAQKLTPIKTPAIIFRNKLPVPVRDCWQHLDIEKDTLAGTSLNRAYQEIIKNKKGKEIIVAVIDTDIDIHHEDLKSVIWINKKEIPDNGIDDDRNGYIDDINGWNFLGNSKGGDNVIYANTESTRILKSLKKKYPIYPSFNQSKEDSLLFITATNRYMKNKQDLINSQVNASTYISKYKKSLNDLEVSFHKSYFTLRELDSLYKKNNDLVLEESILFMRTMWRLGKTYQSLQNDSIKIVQEYNTTYNEQYYDREILGDNELDIQDKHYGNSIVFKNAPWTYHGTIVSGIIAADRTNGIGIQGFSSQIKIMPIQAIPSGGSENDKDVALAIRYAVDNGAKIINMSFGKTSSANPEWIKDAFLYAEQHDVLLVAGSGNDYSNNDIYPFYPIDYNEQTLVEYCGNFIKVGAINMDGDKNFLASFTNYGKKTVDLFAPGYFLKTTYPENKYAYRDGTSMSGPIVSGVAALVRSHYPKLTAAQVKQIILESGVAYDLMVQVPGEKEGVLRPFSEMSKSGRVVNAYNALLMAEEMSRKKVRLNK
ncbi:MAG: S8 family serine peptidase [Flavobacterium sp.]